MSTEDLTRYERQILANVEEFGCHITVVGASQDDDDEDEPGNSDTAGERFAYSVGLPRTVGQPEIIVFGFSTELSAAVINTVLAMCREGLVLEDWAEIDGLLKDHRCIARDVRPQCLVPSYFNAAIWFAEHEGHDFSRAMQIVWPGVDDGLFPWDKGCSPDVRALQTPLYRTSLNS